MKIIDATPAEPEATLNPEPKPKPTGIRRTAQGGWAAVKNGRLVRDFVGTGSKARAIKAAGTNAVIA